MVGTIDPLALGHAIISLGGGRTRQDQEIDPRVGFVLRVETGQRVSRGDPLAVVHAATPSGLVAGAQAVRDAVRLGEMQGSARLPLIAERIRGREPGAGPRES